MIIFLLGKGTITKLNIWTNNGTTVTNILSKVQNCSAADTGSVFNWKTFQSNTHDKIYLQIPSECDGISMLLCCFIAVCGIFLLCCHILFSLIQCNCCFE